MFFVNFHNFSFFQVDVRIDEERGENRRKGDNWESVSQPTGFCSGQKEVGTGSRVKEEKMVRWKLEGEAEFSLEEEGGEEAEAKEGSSSVQPTVIFVRAANT